MVTENPKGGIVEKRWKVSEGGQHKFAWKIKTVWEGGGGGRESHQMLLGGITSVK